MARKPKPKTEQQSQTSSLAEALEFVSLAQSSQGTLYETHVVLHNNWLTAFNGVIAAGVPIQEQITACPHSATFTKALARCGDQYTLTQLDAKLCIAGDKFKAFVPCCPFEEMQRAYPDLKIAVLGDEFRKSLKMTMTDEFSEDNRIIAKSILARANTCVGTNGVLLIEHWHGFDLPTMTLPKAFATALSKTRKTIVGFGCSNVSATVHFDDSSWLRCQLYVDEWSINIEKLFDFKPNMWPVPPDFFEGVKALLPFLKEDSAVMFDKGRLRTHSGEMIGAQYVVTGLPDGPVFNAKYLIELEPLAKMIDFIGGENKDRAFFKGDSLRGLLMGVKNDPS